jgi:hypothetical protein
MPETISNPMDNVMPVIVIKDLPDSTELDREAMLAIVGGARSGVHRHFRPRTAPRKSAVTRIVPFPPGFAPTDESGPQRK